MTHLLPADDARAPGQARPHGHIGRLRNQLDRRVPKLAARAVQTLYERRQAEPDHILSHTDPLSMVHPSNLPATCGVCHEDQEFLERHSNRRWPASFPATRPVMALDRIYARGARNS